MNNRQLQTSDFDYELPKELIAQTPVEPRDHSRLMVLHRATKIIEHRRFYEIVEYLEKGDVVVCNNSRVIPAKIRGQKKGTSSEVEFLLLQRLDEGLWKTLARPGKKLPVGAVVQLIDSSGKVNEKIAAEVVGEDKDGIKIVCFPESRCLHELGQIPLPPYIRTPLTDPDRYQTVYAKVNGSVAAPTAGLHFTPELLKKLEEKGVKLEFVTLHIGLDTFRPVRTDDPTQHPIHTEYGEISREVAELINHARRAGKRVVAIGTSTVRLLELAGQKHEVQPYAGWVDLFILPGHQFKVVDAMVTNFHLPRSTTIMLVSAFTGKDFLFAAYKEAVRNQYRFYSFGDAMLIL